MKKSISVLLVVVFMCSLVLFGCSNKSQTDNATKVATGSTKEVQKPLDYPKKPIKIVVPWGAGGGTDAFVRTLAIGAEKYLGQPLNVVNRGGAGGTIATTEFMKEKPDGNSIIIEAIGVFSTQPKLNDVAYTSDDFEPIIGTTVDPIILVTSKDTGITNFEELKEYVKSNTVNFGYTGTGSLHHVGGTALFGELGADINGVTFAGGGELIAALMGGHVDFASLHPVNIMSHEESDTFVPLVVLSSERIEQFPDVPCVKELGFDFEFEVWKFIMAPKGTPQEILDYLYEGINNIMNDPEIRATFEKGGATFLKDNKPEDVSDKLKNNIEVTGKVLDDLGLSKK